MQQDLLQPYELRTYRSAEGLHLHPHYLYPYKNCLCGSSNPPKLPKYCNVIPQFFNFSLNTRVAKKPDKSGFSVRAILLVTPICKFKTKKMTYYKRLFFELCQKNHIKMYVSVFSLCKFSSMCTWHMELFVLGD